MFSFFALIPGLVGLAIYVGLAFWAGTRGWWWLVLLISMPALLGGLMTFVVDMSQSQSPLFQNFGWLVSGQIIIGVITYLLGRMKAKSKNDSSKEFE